MSERRRFFRAIGSLLLGLAIAAGLHAQQRLYVLEPDNNYHPVLRVSGEVPFIGEQGKLVPAKGRRFALRKVEDFLPVMVTVRDFESLATGWRVMGVTQMNLGTLNKGYHFSAKFETDFALEDVFVVIELILDKSGTSIFVHEVGQLLPGKEGFFTADLPAERDLGPGRIQLHLFSGGIELLHSVMPEKFREELLDRLIARQIAAVTEAVPRRFYGPAPSFPTGLSVAMNKGEARLNVRISARGRVLEAAVEHATDPAFGEAALLAIRQWRFLPQVTAGRAVETWVKIPLVFAAPGKADGKD